MARLLAREQLGGVRADHLGEVGDDDRLGVDDGPAQRLGLGAAGLRDPDGREAEGGLGGRDARELTHGVARVHGHMVTRHHAAARNFRATDAHDVLVRVQADVVADADGRDDHAELGGDLAADRADAGEQRAAGLLVDERHQAEADRELERVERERVERGVARRGQLRLLGRRGGRGAVAALPAGAWWACCAATSRRRRRARR